MEKIPIDYQDLLLEPNFAHVATVSSKGIPQVTPVWIDYELQTNTILFNTAKGRIKYRNICSNPHIALSILDRNNPYRYITIQGKVTKLDDDQARAVAHIDKLTQKYMGREKFSLPEGQQRVIVHIKPLRVHVSS